MNFTSRSSNDAPWGTDAAACTDREPRQVSDRHFLPSGVSGLERANKERIATAVNFKAGLKNLQEKEAVKRHPEPVATIEEPQNGSGRRGKVSSTGNCLSRDSVRPRTFQRDDLLLQAFC